MIVVSRFRIGFFVLNLERCIALSYLNVLFIFNYLVNIVSRNDFCSEPHGTRGGGGGRLSLLQTLT